MAFITIVTGAYKPTYNWGAPHCSNMENPTKTHRGDHFNGNYITIFGAAAAKIKQPGVY